MAKSYWEKLQDPRWQRRRLEALEKAEFACELCYDNESPLHVHHKEYFKGREPWEYELEQLAVLCEGCHSNTHGSDDRLRLICSRLDIDGPRSRDEMASLISGYSGNDLDANADSHFSYFIGDIAQSLSCSGAVFLKIDDVIKLASLCRSHSSELRQTLMDFIDKFGKEAI
jgi:hypothetical protein